MLENRPLDRTDKVSRGRTREKLAEGVGFEPTVPARGTTVFETAPIDHSGTPPQGGVVAVLDASTQGWAGFGDVIDWSVRLLAMLVWSLR